MRCWRCKQDMPDGLKYCGNCGVHMNRTVHFFQWLFSKKGLPVLIVLLALIVGGVIWAVLENVDFPDTDIHVELPVGDDDREPLEDMYDFGVCPDELSFIVGNTKDGDLFQNQDMYFYVEGAIINFSMEANDETGLHDYVLQGNHPHWWAHYLFVDQLKNNVADYLQLLDEKPFYFELVHQQSFGGNDEYNSLSHNYYHDAGEYYFYRYTGVQNTFGLYQPDFVEGDLGEINLIIRILEAEDGIHFETWTDLGLESIYREEQEDILNGIPYHRTVEDRIVTEDTP